MKHLLYSLITTGLILFSHNARGQEFSCDQFCVENIQMDTANPGQMIVTIYFSGDSNDFINYPHVDFILDPQGDTIGDGDLAFFGQIGMTRLDYNVFTSLAAIPSNFHAIVYFRYDDTICALNYPCTTSSIDISEVSNAIHIAPNPFLEEVNIIMEEGLKDVTMIIFDAHGRQSARVTNLSGKYIWHRDNLRAGIYYLQFFAGDKLVGIKKVIVAD